MQFRSASRVLAVARTSYGPISARIRSGLSLAVVSRQNTSESYSARNLRRSDPGADFGLCSDCPNELEAKYLWAGGFDKRVVFVDFSCGVGGGCGSMRAVKMKTEDRRRGAIPKPFGLEAATQLTSLMASLEPAGVRCDGRAVKCSYGGRRADVR